VDRRCGSVFAISAVIGGATANCRNVAFGEVLLSHSLSPCLVEKDHAFPELRGLILGRSVCGIAAGKALYRIDSKWHSFHSGIPFWHIYDLSFCNYVVI
jgi:hypothetical protein